MNDTAEGLFDRVIDVYITDLLSKLPDKSFMVSAGFSQIGCGHMKAMKKACGKKFHSIKCIMNEWPQDILEAYRTGNSCSKCPDDLKCNHFYSGLCGESDFIPV